jgi:hypothetical protein
MKIKTSRVGRPVGTYKRRRGRPNKVRALFAATGLPLHRIAKLMGLATRTVCVLSSTGKPAGRKAREALAALTARVS